MLGNCLDSRLSVPVYETAFALSRLLEKRGARARSEIKLVLPATPGDLLGEPHTAGAIISLLAKHNIDILLDFAPARISEKELIATDGASLGESCLGAIFWHWFSQVIRESWFPIRLAQSS